MTLISGERFFYDSMFPFSIRKYDFARNEHIPLHTHDFVELVYVVSGSAGHELAGLNYTISTGDVFVIEPNVYHSYTCSGGEQAVVYNVLFNVSLLQKELHALSEVPFFLDFFYLAPFLRKNSTFSPYLSVSGHEKVQLEVHLDAMFREYSRNEIGYQLIVKTRLIETMVLLSRYYQRHGRFHQEQQSDKDWMDAVVSLLEQHYDQPFTLEQLSRMCGMSVSSFTVKFRQVTGKSVVEYKHFLQLGRACRLLEDTDRKIIDICGEAGFNDLSFFYRVFGKMFGMTPAQYRKTHRQKM